MRVLRLMPLVAALAFPAVAAAQEHHEGQLGTVRFPVACSAAAQEQMHRAVAMLHSFWFTEASKTFGAAIQADSTCGIAYWGIALSSFGNPMGGGTVGAFQAAGYDAAVKAAKAGGRTPRDQGYVDAAMALFKDYETVPNGPRMKLYEAALRSIVTRFPADTEAIIFDAIFT